jgi:thiol-disulfide isomerase/thioredoxin
MQLSILQRLIVALCLPAAAVLLWAQPGMTQETKPAEEVAAQETADQEAAAQEAADPFAVPEGDAVELLQFMAELQRMRPQVKSYAEFMEHRKKVAAATIEAVDKILASEPTDEQTVAAVQAKLQMLNMLMGARDTQAGEQLEAFLESLKEDKRPAIARLVRQFALMQQIGQWPGLDDDHQKALVGAVLAFAKQGPADMEGLRLVMGLGQTAERSDGKSLAAELYRNAAPIFAQSKDERVASYGEKMLGIARRLTLLGKPMEIKGELLGGKSFDWSAYRGKVVLVDFWATWCGPCIAELPNVKKNYALYHDKGFDVVGISLDTDKERLVKFIETQEVPWPILFSKDEATQGWDNPTATYYGITGIPTAILVDQKGNVVTLSARGPALTQQLEQLLGKVEDEEPAETEKETAETSGG